MKRNSLRLEGIHPAAPIRPTATRPFRTPKTWTGVFSKCYANGMCDTTTIRMHWFDRLQNHAGFAPMHGVMDRSISLTGHHNFRERGIATLGLSTRLRYLVPSPETSCVPYHRSCRIRSRCSAHREPSTRDESALPNSFQTRSPGHLSDRPLGQLDHLRRGFVPHHTETRESHEISKIPEQQDIPTPQSKEGPRRLPNDPG
jgi:hypothetical protein